MTLWEPPLLSGYCRLCQETGRELNDRVRYSRKALWEAGCSTGHCLKSMAKKRFKHLLLGLIRNYFIFLFPLCSFSDASKLLGPVCEGWYGKSFGKSRWGARSNGLPHLCLARTEGRPFVSYYPVALINKTNGLCFLSHFFW